MDARNTLLWLTFLSIVCLNVSTELICGNNQEDRIDLWPEKFCHNGYTVGPPYPKSRRACYCKDGYIRSRKNSKCITLEKCYEMAEYPTYGEGIADTEKHINHDQSVWIEPTYHHGWDYANYNPYDRDDYWDEAWSPPKNSNPIRDTMFRYDDPDQFSWDDINFSWGEPGNPWGEVVAPWGDAESAWEEIDYPYGTSDLWGGLGYDNPWGDWDKSGRIKRLSISAPMQYCNKPNEVWEFRPQIEPTCANPNPLNVNSNWGCYCVEGYVRNAESDCIRREDCPNPIGGVLNLFGFDNPLDDLEKGGRIRRLSIAAPMQYCNKPNEVWELRPQIEPTCANPNPLNVNSNWGCYCVEGYVRNAESDCIRREDCSNPIGGVLNLFGFDNPLDDLEKGGRIRRLSIAAPMQYCNKPNEVWELRPQIEPTCANPNPLNVNSNWGCYCVEGYVRNAESDCIRREDCPNPIGGVLNLLGNIINLVKREEPSCVAGKAYRRGCDVCVCKIDGARDLCTINRTCKPRELISDEFRCFADDLYVIEEFVCICNGNGDGVTCEKNVNSDISTGVRGGGET